MILWFRNSLASGTNFLIAREWGSSSSTATTATGWTVSNVAATKYALLQCGAAVAAATFGASALPSAGPSNAAKDCLVTEAPLSGTFAAGTWTIGMSLIAATATVVGGNLRCRVYRGTKKDGSGTNVEITSGAIDLSAVSSLTTAAAQNTSGTFSPGALRLNCEYLLFQFAWKISSTTSTTAGVRLRTDMTNSRFTLPTFTRIPGAYGDYGMGLGL